MCSHFFHAKDVQKDFGNQTPISSEIVVEDEHLTMGSQIASDHNIFGHFGDNIPMVS